MKFLGVFQNHNLPKIDMPKLKSNVGLLSLSSSQDVKSKGSTNAGSNMNLNIFFIIDFF